MEKQFETEQVVSEFERLFKQSFPEGCEPRQKADLLAFFLAGYISHSQDMAKAMKTMGVEGGALFMDEVIEDTFERAKYLIESVVKGDLSHSMFN